MPNWTLAIQNANGLTGSLGQIIALDTDNAKIRSITADSYSRIDDTATGWDNEVEPGWWLTARSSRNNYTLLASPPATQVDTLKFTLRKLQNQLLEWEAEATNLAPYHRAWQRDFAHDGLASGHECAYIISNDTSIAIADRIAWAETMMGGASDGQGGRIASASQFYALFTTQQAFPDGYACWVDPSDPTTPLLLNALHMVTGTIPAGALDTDWIENITS